MIGRSVLGELKDALVEFQPAEFAVEETIFRQRLLARLKLSPVILVGFGDMLSYLAAQNRL